MNIQDLSERLTPQRDLQELGEREKHGFLNCLNDTDLMGKIRLKIIPTNPIKFPFLYCIFINLTHFL